MWGAFSLGGGGRVVAVWGSDLGGFTGVATWGAELWVPMGRTLWSLGGQSYGARFPLGEGADLWGPWGDLWPLGGQSCGAEMKFHLGGRSTGHVITWGADPWGPCGECAHLGGRSVGPVGWMLWPLVGRSCGACFPFGGADLWGAWGELCPLGGRICGARCRLWGRSVGRAVLVR